jgi:hypothetical protein
MSYKILNKIIESSKKTYPERHIDCSGMGILQIRYILKDLDKEGLWAELTVQAKNSIHTFCWHTYFDLKDWDRFQASVNSGGMTITDIWITDIVINNELPRKEYADLPDLEYWRERILG